MKTTPLNDMNDFVEDLVISYEARLNKMGSIFTTTEAISESSNHLFNDFHNSIQDLRDERGKLNFNLRETLAKNGSLRRKDYDRLMERILIFLEEKENEAEKHFCNYIEGQKVMAQTIKTGLLGLNEAQSTNTPNRIKNFKQELECISKEQETRKDFVMEQFLSFQEIHDNVTNKFNGLLKNVEEVRVKDIKIVINDLLNNQ